MKNLIESLKLFEIGRNCPIFFVGGSAAAHCGKPLAYRVACIKQRGYASPSMAEAQPQIISSIYTVSRRLTAMCCAEGALHHSFKYAAEYST